MYSDILFKVDQIREIIRYVVGKEEIGHPVKVLQTKTHSFGGNKQSFSVHVETIQDLSRENARKAGYQTDPTG